MPAPGTATFGEQHFGAAQLGDRRRTRRLVALADRFLAHPRGWLPQKCGDPAVYQALLGLLDAPTVTHHSVLQPHRERTLRRLADHPGQTTLLPGDITELDFTSRTSLRGQLGRLGDGRGYGYECFNLLAVRYPSRQLLGLANQVLFTRRRAGRREAKEDSRRHLRRQSRLWVRCHEGLPPAPAGQRRVYLFDREGDTTEASERFQRDGKEYVVRSHADRRVLAGHEADGPILKLHGHLRGLAPQAWRAVAVAARQGQAARTAACALSWAAVRVLPPRQPRGEHGRAPLAVWALRLWEPQAPAGAKPLEWLLLTNAAVAAAGDAQERAAWYETRRVAEEYHKAQKTGCDIERPQLGRAERLEPLLALLSVVAVALLGLRDASRDPAQAARPASERFAAAYVEVLSGWRYRQTRPEMTVGEFFQALARLGGHQGRKGDGPPGWLVLWRGWLQLQAMVQGVLSHRLGTCDQS